MAARSGRHSLAASSIPDSTRFIELIDHILVMNYLKPDLRLRVISLQRRLIEAELNEHYRAAAPRSDRSLVDPG